MGEIQSLDDLEINPELKTYKNYNSDSNHNFQIPNFNYFYNTLRLQKKSWPYIGSSSEPNKWGKYDCFTKNITEETTLKKILFNCLHNEIGLNIYELMGNYGILYNNKTNNICNIILYIKYENLQVILDNEYDYKSNSQCHKLINAKTIVNVY